MTARGRVWRGRAPPSVWARAARGATAAAGCHAGAAAGVVRSAALTPRAAARRREADMVDGGGVPRGVMGRRGRALSEDLQIPAGISKKICHVTRKSAPERRHSPERCPPRARAVERARRFESRSETPPPSARRLGRSEMSPVNEDVAAVAKKMESILDHNLWPGFDKFKLVQVRADPPAAVPPRSTSSSSPPRRVPRARARASRRRSLARRAMSLFPRGRFFRPSVFFFRRRTTNNAPTLPPLPSLPRASSTATRF